MRIRPGPTPRIWYDDENIVVQDLPAERQHEAVEHFNQSYARDEPLFRSLKMADDESNMADAANVLASCFEDGVSLIAVEKRSDRIVGLNALRIIHKESAENDSRKTYNDATMGTGTAKIVEFLENVESKVDLFEHFGVDTVLDILALSVDRQCRGMGIGERLMSAMVDLAREAKVSVCKSVFTGIYSQRIARRLGMTSLSEVRYRDYTTEGGQAVFKDVDPHVSACLMALEVQ